jgi:hypothetical protein
MSELAAEITEMRGQGFNDVQIAKILCIPLGMIPEEQEDDEVVEYDDLMADAEALASAGWGTDEDYGSAADVY